MTPIIAANWLNISINLLLVIHVIVCLLLALVVLMQRPKQEGLGAAFGSGLTDQAFGARTTDVLQKGTVTLGTLFFVITLILAILIGKRQNVSADMSDDSGDTTEEVSMDAVPTPLEEEAPVTMPKDDEVKMPEDDKVPVNPTPPSPVPPVEESGVENKPAPDEGSESGSNE